MIKNASLKRRFAACVYELLSLIAIWLLCTFIFLLAHGNVETGFDRFLLQLSLWVVTGFYLITCWVKTGQTLAAQAWKIKVVDVNNDLPTIGQSVLRYLFVTISLFGFGLGFLWSFVDKEHLFLHDRLAKTKLIKLVNN